MSVSGGCQCGAVRYRAQALGRPSLCHCRMCQKAMGGPFGPFVSVKVADLTWTRGERKRFASSNKVWRGFCGDCGTPLTFEWSQDTIDLAFYTLDRPEAAAPEVQLEAQNALPWVNHIGDLPVRDAAAEPHLAAYLASVVSNQHPDHDT